jgi:hypothetical protein
MARQTAGLEDEFETEFESEFESEYESEWEGEWEDEGEGEEEYEDEAFLGLLGPIARVAGGLLGGGGDGEYELEEEGEWEDEGEGEEEYEDEAFLGLLGPIARVAGGLLGGGGDGEYELEEEGEWEEEAEAEEFFKRLRGVLSKATPYLKRFGPLVATALGGPAAGAVARAVASQLEGEIEGELEGEFEEMAAAPLAPSQTFAEYLAAQAAATESESEAEALSGAAAYAAINPDDRRELARLLPQLLRGAATITRVLYGNRRTRPAVRLVPGIADGTARAIARRVAAGEPVSRVELGQVMGAVTSQALAPGAARQAVLRRHARGLARARRRYFGPGRRGYGRRMTGARYPRPRSAVRRYGQGRATAMHRQPVRSRIVAGRGPVSRPRPGLMRVTTPLLIPARGGQQARVVRVVSDVRVPRGATPAGRPTSTAGRRAR